MSEAATAQIEPAVSEDASHLQRMLTEVFTENFIGYTIYQSPQSANFLRTLIENPSANYIRVIRNGSEISAFSVSSLQERTAHLGFIGVSPSHEGTGLARMLLEDLIGFTRSSGRHALTLDVFADNEKPYHWYLKRGFVEQEKYCLARIRLVAFADGSAPIAIHADDLSAALEDEKHQGFGNVRGTVAGETVELGLIGGRRLRLRSAFPELIALLPALSSAFCATRESLIVSSTSFSIPEGAFESKDVTLRMRLDMQ